MEAKELRIGNYVTVDNQDSWRNLEGVTLIVTGINNHMDSQDLEFFPDSDGKVSIKSEYETYGQFSQFIKPIPLTEEWLLKFGFEKEIIDDKFIRKTYYYIDDFEVEFHGKRIVFRVENRDSVMYFAHHTLFVHQLQNLYFVITNNELTISK